MARDGLENHVDPATGEVIAHVADATVEDALDALTERNLADGEARPHALVGAGDAHALIGLHAGALALLDLDVDDQCVTGLELRDRLAKALDLLGLEGRDQVHVKLHPFRHRGERFRKRCCELAAAIQDPGALVEFRCAAACNSCNAGACLVHVRDTSRPASKRCT